MNNDQDHELAGDGAELKADGTPHALALTALIAGAVTLGMSPIFVRLSELGPTATAFHRVFLALPVIWVWYIVDTRRQNPAGTLLSRPETSRDYIYLSLAGVFFAGDLAFWHWSLKFTSVANATLFATLAPIWVTLGSFLIFKERFSLVFLMGVALAITGGGILMGDSFQIGGEHLFGDVLGVVTGLFFGSYILTVGRLRNRFSTAAIMFYSTLVTAAVLVPVTFLSGESWVATTLYGWFILFGLAWFTHVGGQGALAFALAHLPAAFSSVAVLLEAVAAAGLAWLILDEALGSMQILGALIVIGGIMIARRGSRKGRAHG